MEHEILKIETARKLADYDKLVREKNNMIQYLKNQVVINKKQMEKNHLLKEKELMIVARSKLGLAQELLKMLDVKR